MSRKVRLTMLVLAISVLASGCGYMDKAGNLDRSGIWGKFVGLVYDTMNYFYDLIGDYGVAIIIVTLIVRLLTFPLMMKQIRYSKVMQQLSPELAKIREKYKDNKEKVQQETMKLFQQYKINPLAGCFPMVIQMPILVALYQSINANKELQHHDFLGILSLSSTHSTENIILAVLAAGTTYLQSKMSMTNKDANTKMMLTVMPLMIAFFTWQFPAALGLYWIVSNCFTIVQTYFTRGIKAAPITPAQGGKTK
ncbi:MAG TPA: YidC/Oxa1 family membrane protein insertase [Bacilli bacterium]|nr:YidC/Oxa1 family membrane protein insertase [Bacilli bacterium]